MSALSKVLRQDEGGRLLYQCQGCGHSHQVMVGEGQGPRWGWNGDGERPTFTPSVLVTWRDFTDAGEAAFEAWHDAGCPKPAPEFESVDFRCHTFITDGRVQFLGDCTHALAGQTLDLPPFPHSEWEPTP